ncbi:MAG: hypothetical protein KTR25_02020 [Myxococcales bacterium]|nr:hypothetical protein [Myxococcales bacterium]
MTPRGWRPPGQSGYDKTYEHLGPGASALRAHSSSEGPPVHWPTSAMADLAGPLWPGTHLVVGPHGSGKTQLLLQTAVHNALMGSTTVIEVPDTPPREASLRVAAVLSGIPWADLAQRPPDESAQWLDRLQGAPIRVEALHEQEVAPLPSELIPSTSLWVVDRYSLDQPLSKLRAQALRREVIVLWAGGSRQPDKPPDPADPLGCAKAYGATDAVLRCCDSVWVIVPELMAKDTQSGVNGSFRLVLAKSRRRLGGYVKHQFTGARFEDQ